LRLTFRASAAFSISTNPLIGIADVLLPPSVALLAMRRPPLSVIALLVLNVPPSTSISPAAETVIPPAPVVNVPPLVMASLPVLLLVAPTLSVVTPLWTKVDPAPLTVSVAFNPDAISQLKAALWTGTPPWDKLLEERAAMSGTLVLSDFTRNAIAEFEKRS
jgi:hypothetical protein